MTAHCKRVCQRQQLEDIRPGPIPGVSIYTL